MPGMDNLFAVMGRVNCGTRCGATTVSALKFYLEKTMSRNQKPILTYRYVSACHKSFLDKILRSILGSGVARISAARSPP